MWRDPLDELIADLAAAVPPPTQNRGGWPLPFSLEEIQWAIAPFATGVATRYVVASRPRHQRDACRHEPTATTGAFKTFVARDGLVSSRRPAARIGK